MTTTRGHRVIRGVDRFAKYWSPGALSGPAAPGAPGAGPEWGISGPRSRPGATGKHVDSGRIRPPGARTGRPDPPLSPWGKNSPRRPTGRSPARIRPGSARTGPKPAVWRPGGPDAAPRSPSGENPSPRTHGGSLDHMHFSRVSGLRGIGSTAFSRVSRNARLRMPSGDPGGSPGTRAAPGRQNSRKNTAYWARRCQESRKNTWSPKTGFQPAR